MQSGGDEVHLEDLASALREGEDGRDPLHHHGVADALQEGDRIVAPGGAGGREGEERQVAQPRLDSQHDLQGEIVRQESLDAVEALHRQQESLPGHQRQQLLLVSPPGVQVRPTSQAGPDPPPALPVRRPGRVQRRLAGAPRLFSGGAVMMRRPATSAGPRLQVRRPDPHRVPDSLQDPARLRVARGSGHPGQHQGARRQ